MRYIKDLVIERRRNGRTKPERTCHCEAAPFPHRLESVPDCYGALLCHHGQPLPGHPAYEGRCPECDREAYGEYLFDCWHDEHGL